MKLITVFITYISITVGWWSSLLLSLLPIPVMSSSDWWQLVLCSMLPLVWWYSEAVMAVMTALPLRLPHLRRHFLQLMSRIAAVPLMWKLPLLPPTATPASSSSSSTSSSSQSSSPLVTLPTVLLYHTASFCTVKELVVLQCCSRFLYHQLGKDQVWKGQH